MAGSAHPVDGGLDIGETGGGGPDEVSHGFSERHARHCSRVDQAFERLLSNGRGGPCKPLVALRHHRHVRYRQLQRPAALLLRHQPCADNSTQHIEAY